MPVGPRPFGIGPYGIYAYSRYPPGATYVVGAATQIAWSAEATAVRIICPEAPTEIAWQVTAEFWRSWALPAPCEEGAWSPAAPCEGGVWTLPPGCSVGVWQRFPGAPHVGL